MSSPSASPATDANTTSPLPATPPPTTNLTVFAPPAPVALPPLLPLPEPPNGLTPVALAGLIVGIGIGGLIVMIGVCIFVVFYRKRKKRSLENHNGPPKDGSYPGLPQYWQENAPSPTANNFTKLSRPTPPPGITLTNSNLSSDKPMLPFSPGKPLGYSQITFTYEELALATNGFSATNLLGQGGFGYVHKGVLPGGKEVAVKQLKAGSGQGEREFQAEVEIISRVHHRHLVSLVGYCILEDQRLLVYEFVSNNTLEFHLHGTRGPPMNWATRMKIAIDSAKGLAYLHEDCQPKIIHRDIKAANILLDLNFEAKVADFGLAKLSLDTDTHVSTRIMGTLGYMAPEYASSGKLTDKSDVFSFGVVLLELLTGRRPIDKAQPFTEDSMVEWARPLLTEAIESGNFTALVDPRLQKNYDPVEVARVAASAASCVRHSSRLRPRMSEIVRALEGNLSLEHLNEGTIPGQRSVYTSGGSTDYDTNQYNEDLEKFRKMALGSQELRSSGQTSESGRGPSASTSMESGKI